MELGPKGIKLVSILWVFIIGAALLVAGFIMRDRLLSDLSHECVHLPSPVLTALYLGYGAAITNSTRNQENRSMPAL
jgi:hypothetical protein